MSAAPLALAIAGELNIYRAAELRDWLHTSLPQGGHVELDLAEVTEMDTAGAQLLLAGKRLAAERGCTLHCVNHSPAVLSLLELFDMAALLGDPMVLPATTEAAA
jgi:anti-anti-sigma factor